MLRSRRGVTLIELLTVLGIVSLLALMVLPTVKSLLTDRKGTQSATMVRNFLEAARARAIGSGVAVAVVFERLSSQPADMNGDGLINDADLVPNSRLISATASDPLPAGSPVETNFLPYNACIRLSMAEQPLPLTDEMIPVFTPVRPTFFSGASGSAPPALVRPGMEYFYCTDAATNPVLKQFLIAGNEISLNLSRSRRMIMQTEFVGSNIWFSSPSRNGLASTLEQAIPSKLPPPFGVGTTNFTIFPKPRSVNGPAIQLPKGTCIDLSLSGFSSVGNVTGRDQRMRFSSAWLYAGAAAPSAQELRPIYVVFTPDGNMSRIYANAMLGSALIPVETADDFFLHLGKIEQVVAVSEFFNVANPAAIDASVKQNIIDPSSYVVRLSPKSGAISAAPITLGFASPGATIGDILELSRQGTYGSQLTAQ